MSDRFYEEKVFDDSEGRGMRFFIRVRDGDGRKGMWAFNELTGQGVFFHGDHEECQHPHFNLERIISGISGLPTREISREAAIRNLRGWKSALELFGIKEQSPC